MHNDIITIGNQVSSLAVVVVSNDESFVDDQMCQSFEDLGTDEVRKSRVSTIPFWTLVHTF